MSNTPSIYFILLGLLVTGTFAQQLAHGPCATEMGTPGDENARTYWTLIFSRAQPGQPNNPKYAKYGDNWAATIAAYPKLKENTPAIIANIKKELPIQVSDPNIPFTRVCAPSAAGLSSGVLKPNDLIIHINPTGAATDATATLFYKAFISRKEVKTIGKSGH